MTSSKHECILTSNPKMSAREHIGNYSGGEEEEELVESRRKGKESDSGSFKGQEGESREDPSKLAKDPKHTKTRTGGRSMWSGGQETGRVSGQGYRK